MTDPKIPPPNVPLVDSRGLLTPSWYRFFAGQEKQGNAAAAGEVAAGAGLTGGGPVSSGATLAVATGGVTSAMLRDSAATSVIGRFQNSTGQPADIVAAANGRVLTRAGDQLAFRDNVDLVDITVDNLKFTGTAVVSAATPSTHKIAVTIGGVAYSLLATT
jgi:hypothetical protein